MNWHNSHYMAELAQVSSCASTGCHQCGTGEAAQTGFPTMALLGQSWSKSLASFLGAILSPSVCRNLRKAPEQEHNWALVRS